ncbi:MAG TPA: NAD(P)-binding domain-containing protein, partial [Candidatus Polarisedimenticolia bacterium]|nr:NAD(P)-binding domain-containing protein [Candidatus Polarisedimenticolia bacterium]
MNSINRIGVLGAGAWGTTLAIVAQRAGRAVTLWARRPEQARALADNRENVLHLPGLPIDPAIDITGDIRAALRADAVLVALPAQHLSEHLAPLA